ncbi:hypothetical protein BDY19DRAFT_890661 [Irpex rosettiformis]|uniref:Uncharacterized protein n=1 Tax=Irpex rosettiformis TaxID=378272 RepID=A0ACB8U3K5_9APHY|nr:hypothetical protein BDY19DRAFT_890661 [Irpex rosettiformis]
MLRRTHTDSSMKLNTPTDSQNTAKLFTSGLQRTPKKLSATKTEPVIDLTCGSPESSRSRPVTPSKSRSLEDTLSPDKGPRPSLANSNIRTYGGKSRSFLVALPTPHIPSTGQDPISQDPDVHNEAEDEYETRESYADLRARWGVDDSEDDPYPFIEETPSPLKDGKGKGHHKQMQPPVPRLPPGMMNDLKSITDLRSKGENRRFLDEMGYLFEGLASDGSLGVRRGSALEIVDKLCDPDFARKAKAADFLGRAWEGLRAAGAGDGDKILDTILVFFAALISRDPIDAADLATRLDFEPILLKSLSHLTHENDPLWLISCGLHVPAMKAAGIPRNDVPQLEGLQKMIQTKSGLFEPSEIISNRLLISLSLEALPPSLHSPACLPIVLNSLKVELSPLSSRVLSYITGLPILPTLSAESYMDIPSLSHIDKCLRLVDAYLLGRWGDDDSTDGTTLLDAARNEGFGSTLITLCCAADIISRTQDAQYLSYAAHRCMESALRVLVNLTHNSLPWCQTSIGSSSGLPSISRLLATFHSHMTQTVTVAEPQDGEEEEEVANYLDKLCLILGLITNLVQTSEESKERIRELKLSPLCPGLRPCAVACRCPERVSALECLVQIYEQPGRSGNDFESVVRGHIAILFGLLMQGHPRTQVILLRLLPGPSNKKKVENVMENVQEFTLFYSEFVKKVAHAAQMEGDDDDQENRQDGADSALRTSQGELVVKHVLTSLQGLLSSFND